MNFRIIFNNNIFYNNQIILLIAVPKKLVDVSSVHCFKFANQEIPPQSSIFLLYIIGWRNWYFPSLIMCLQWFVGILSFCLHVLTIEHLWRMRSRVSQAYVFNTTVEMPRVVFQCFLLKSMPQNRSARPRRRKSSDFSWVVPLIIKWSTRICNCADTFQFLYILKSNRNRMQPCYIPFWMFIVFEYSLFTFTREISSQLA